MNAYISNIVDKSLRETENSITVNKHLQLEYDLGTLLATDINSLDLTRLRKDKNDYTKQLSRDNVQLLFNEIWRLPTDRVEESIVAKLPSSNFVLPRSRPLPKSKPLTKWEQFAKAKGIKKTKKTKQNWDDQLNKWIPSYGYKRAQADKEKDWVLEVPATSDPMEDQFLKKKTGKRENVAKNELQRLRNIAKAKKIKIPRLGLTNSELSSAKELQTAVTLTRSATASLGKFQNKLPKEKEGRGLRRLMPNSSVKSKSGAVSTWDEKQNNMNIVNSVISGRPKLNVEKAVGRHLKYSGNSDDKEETSKKSQRSRKPINTKRKRSLQKNAPGKGKKKKETHKRR
ncbi:hypothetical protein PPYR_13236 [Photinus pyralis]|uniref:Ribosome biogenesis regulatory protein n=1 Tax=Photinus pyralis TaxID=7054 RepID=A0A1Y1N8H0_PHOPY|nr:ribosome biogenesis regulatory protein homolog [Photinus pyralis]KAB0793616.1 hypothetical protein PPYR_13236 [Photinus pyralis]